MRSLPGPAPDVPTLLATGAVAAWRCGLAQLRVAALEAAGRLPGRLLAAALGVPAVADDTVARLAADPWRDPLGPDRDADSLVVVARVGAFRGFGGVFRRPPVVAGDGVRLWAGDDAGGWRVHADRYGAAFSRLPEAPRHGRGAPGLRLSAGGLVSDTAGRTLHVPELEAASWTVAGRTLAASSPWTHAITLVAAV